MENPISTNGVLVIIEDGAKQTNVDAGVFGQMSLADDYFYICVKTGTTDAIWKKFAITQT